MNENSTIECSHGRVRSVRCYSVPNPITTGPSQLYYWGNIHALSDGTDTIAAGEEIRDIIIELLEARKIDWVAVQGNEFSVKVTRISEWDEVHSLIIQIITKHVFRGHGLVLDPHQRKREHQ